MKEFKTFFQISVRLGRNSMDFSPCLLCFDLVCVFYFQERYQGTGNFASICTKTGDFRILAWADNDVITGNRT